MHRLIAIVATLLLSASALAHAPRASVGALPFGEPTRIEASNAARIEQAERQANAALAAKPHTLENASRQAKTAYRAHARQKHAESARASALTHCLVLESWLFGWKCASGEVIDGDPMMPATLNEYLAFNGNPTVYVDPDGRCAVPSLCAYAYSRNDEQRMAAMRSFANTVPGLGETAGVAIRGGQIVMAPVNAATTTIAAIQGDPGARATVADTATAAGDYAAQRLMTLATEGFGGLLHQDMTNFGTSIGESAGEMAVAQRRGDRVGVGMAGVDLTSQLAAVVPVLRATSIARANVARAGIEGTKPIQLTEAPDGSVGVKFNDPLSELPTPVTGTPPATFTGTPDELGRPTGVFAVLDKSVINTGTSASSQIRPPGFQGGAAGHARGHLLGRQLGGSGNNPENLVTLYQNPANTPTMSGFEGSVRAALEAGETMNYRAIPRYEGDDLMPIGVTIDARGSQGFNLSVSVRNIPKEEEL